MQNGWTKSAPKKEPQADACALGAYIQLVDENGAWPRTAWLTLFDSFHKLRVKNLVVQWSVYDQKAFYRSQHFTTVDTRPLETILELADTAGLRVVVGLSHDENYWANIQKKDKRPYLMERLRKNMEAAAELAPLVSMHKSFAGWYISEEIDDINWRQADARAALISYLQQTSTFLRIISPPGTIISISGFANAKTAPEELEMFWLELLTRVDTLDRVYFQDGVGVGKLNFNNLDRYYQAIHNATLASRREFIPVIEVFEQTAGEPLSPGPFAASPTRLPTVLKQIKIARKYSAQPIAFGIPEYMTPSGGEPARALYNAYLKNQRNFDTACGKKP